MRKNTLSDNDFRRTLRRRCDAENGTFLGISRPPRHVAGTAFQTEWRMSMPGSTADYLADLQRITAAMAVGQSVEDVLDAITAGMRTSGQMLAVSVSLYLHDGECPLCQARAPVEPSAERRLHRVAFYSQSVTASAHFHATRLGKFFAGYAAQERRLLVIDDMEQAIEEYAADASSEAKAGFRMLLKAGARTAVFVPMVAHDALVGVLTVLAARDMDVDELRYLEVVATQAATILRSAQL